MDFFLYFVLGIMDILAVFALSFKIFRLPYFENFRDFLIVAVFVNSISYVLRVILELPFLDPPFQLFVFVLFLRYRIKFRLSSAILLAVIGNACFNSIQFILYNILNATGFLTRADALSTSAVGTYTLQFVNDLSCYLIGFLLYRSGLGFAFISAPPHDLSYKDKIINRPIFAFLIICSALVCLTIVFIDFFIDYFIYVSLLYVAALSVLIYFAYRKDYER